MVNTMILSLPGESHRRRHSISGVLPLIHKCPFAAQPLSDKVPCTPICLKTHKVRYQISPFVDFRHTAVEVSGEDRGTNPWAVAHPLKWTAASWQSTPPGSFPTKPLWIFL